ncbi:MAG: EamA family transporter [Hamadaea sp.]|uniref:DMT family transporter n=1 Tax=Hamadaea sp. NPDC050747 TaxID=3155789 RepID=UPI0017E6EC7A|nr:EamA family transporter [Hamadaea sp.]NUR52692.1 EamA family transporter [Hamadaea sp.]NUT03184.1 EamA family transporter [Hamadaea sp.]
MSRKGWLLFAALGIIWGVPYLFIKIAVGGLTPASVVFWRCAIAALILLPIAIARGQLRALLPHWKALLAFTAAEIAVPWFLLTSAEQRLSSSLAGLLIAGVPLVAALLGWATGGERLGPRRILGLGVGLAGVAALVGLDLSADDTWALVQMAIVVIGYAVGPFILNRQLKGVPGLAVMAVSLALSAIVYAPAGIMQHPAELPGADVIVAVLVLAVLCTAVALTVFNALIAEVGPVRGPVITYINPAVAVILGVLVLGEPFTAGIGLGFALVLAGSVLATQRAADKKAPAPGPAEAAGVEPVASRK